MIFSRLDLSGARTILTGASSGIGHALALRLAERGARLALAGRNRERLAALAETIRGRGGEAVAVPTDVADPAQRAGLVGQALADLGGLDILINNAGVGALGFFETADEARLRQIMEVNFFAATELTRLALPHLRRGRSPMIVNVASVLARRAVPGMVEYCASKFAMAGWSEGLRAELARAGIHVLLVCPGGIETEFDAHMIERRARLTWRNRRRMPADRCAQLIVGAMRRRKNEVVITLSGKLMLLANRVAPRLLDWVLARLAKDEGSATTGRPS
jgi:short-subunit dehydrogenase